MADLKKINDTTLTADELGDVKPKVAIGGKDDKKFIPNLNASFFDDEFYFNLNRKNKTAVDVADALGVAQITGEDTDDFYIDESGRLKWDIVFDSCPESLTLEWELKCSNELEFFYQGELTEEEIADGCVRPDDVVGSYAVYCNKANNKYKTGKLTHIYRPFVVDANGAREWAVLLIENGKLAITLPEKFMLIAKYPVRLDPTFGYTSIGGSSLNLNGRDPTGSMYSPRTAVSGDTITGYSLVAFTWGSTGNVDVAAYTIVSGGLASRLASAANISGITGGDAAWYSVSGLSQAMTASSVYGSAVGNGVSCRGCYDSAGSNYMDTDTYGGALPSSWHTAYSVKGAYILSLYATYTESGGATANNYYYMMNQ